MSGTFPANIDSDSHGKDGETLVEPSTQQRATIVG
jgi:hypothetical protein